MCEKLFVYGTLCPGRPNEHLLQQIGGEFVKASVHGTLHEEGWGATMGYPAIKLHESAGKVQGYVFSSKDLAEHWTELDEFEGEAYRRIPVNAELENGEIIKAWVYALHPSLG